MKLSYLIAQREAVISSIQGSTCCQDFPGMDETIDLYLNAAQGRAESAVMRSQERSNFIRGAIRKATGTLSHDWDSHALAGVIHRRIQAHPGEYGLKKAPSLPTIRDEILLMQQKANFGTETSLSTCHTSTMQST